MRERTPQFVSAPLPEEAYDNLIGNNVIAKQDIQLEKVNENAMRNLKLLVRLSPEITLDLIKKQGSLYATINENTETSMRMINQNAMWPCGSSARKEIWNHTRTTWRPVSKSISEPCL